jgi:hypothetical protein
MCPVYIATGMPRTNLLILHKFHFLGILECTVFCAVYALIIGHFMNSIITDKTWTI